MWQGMMPSFSAFDNLIETGSLKYFSSIDQIIVLIQTIASLEASADQMPIQTISSLEVSFIEQIIVFIA